MLENQKEFIKEKFELILYAVLVINGTVIPWIYMNNVFVEVQQQQVRVIYVVIALMVLGIYTVVLTKQRVEEMETREEPEQEEKPVAKRPFQGDMIDEAHRKLEGEK